MPVITLCHEVALAFDLDQFDLGFYDYTHRGKLTPGNNSAEETYSPAVDGHHYILDKHGKICFYFS